MAVTSYALSWFGDQISDDDKYVRLTRGSRPAERVERRLGTSLAPCAGRARGQRCQVGSVCIPAAALNLPIQANHERANEAVTRAMPVPC
jgi:hypothetical protein